MIRIKHFLDLIAMSKISIFGSVLVTTAVGADAMLIIGELLIFESNPYIGIIAYVLFPGMAATGLVLIPIGILLVMRKSHRDPVGKLVRKASRKHVARLIVSLTLINFVLFAFVGYRSIHFMESAEFCGLTCHEVMSPEYTVYQKSHHSGIACVECHVGPGIGWLIKSKLDGTRQLAGVVLDNYSRPIETPIHNMRPAEHICGECHSQDSYIGQKLKVFQRYEPDQYNTKTFSVINLRLGEPEGHGEGLSGIHWHSQEGMEIRYWSSDDEREQVVRVEMVNEHGEKNVWTKPGDQESSHAGNGHDEAIDHGRLMDCTDCHNRPTHEFLAPDLAIDNLLAAGEIDPEIPWIRAISFEVLTQQYETDSDAMAAIADLLRLYSEQYGEPTHKHAEALRDAVPVLQELHETYVYPEMKIEWNTYPARIGHPTAHTSACFRCHGGLLVDPNGIQITNDCCSCHYVLAEDEKDPVIMRLLED